MQEFFSNSGLESSYLRDLSEKCTSINGINLSQGVCDDGSPAKYFMRPQNQFLMVTTLTSVTVASNH